MKEFADEDIEEPIPYHKKIKQIDDKFKSIINNKEKLNSKMILVNAMNLKGLNQRKIQ